MKKLILLLAFSACANFGVPDEEVCTAGEASTCDGIDGNVLVSCDADLGIKLRQTCPTGTTCNAADNSCDVNGIPPFCGDGNVDAGEGCDDGNNDGDPCNADCTIPACGDTFLNPTEECDDGNTANGDGCDDACQFEVPPPPPSCGDGLAQAPEECDDNNNVNGDACNANCTLPACGDTFLSANEECEDGNALNGDGCDSNCQIEELIPGCGNSFLDVGEECDDGNNIDGDNCEADCSFPTCGNGIVDPSIGEECDDGNFVDNDGCDADCTHADILQVTNGTNFTCALLDTHNVRCWGQNDAGQLGYGNTSIIGNTELPFQATGGIGNGADVSIGGPVAQIEAGTFHVCALLQSGGVRCWGGGGDGRLGYGNVNNSGVTPGTIPSALGDIALGGSAIQIGVGGEFTCALMSTRSVRCWGRGFTGRLGYGNTNSIGDDETPAQAYATLPNNGDINIGGTVAQLSVGLNHSCVLLTTGKVRCWGFSGGTGKLGYPNQADVGDNEVPSSVTTGANGTADVDLDGSVIQITTGNLNTCALLNTGKVRCWGSSNLGQTGYENTSTIGDNESPAQAHALLPNNGDLTLGGQVVQIEASPSHTCAVLSTGEVRCWGENAVGELGIGNINIIGDNSGEMPPATVSIGASAIRVSAGDSHTCALLDTGRVRCWGQGGQGRLGYNNGDIKIGDDELPSTIYNTLPGNGDVQVAGPAVP